MPFGYRLVFRLINGRSGITAAGKTTLSGFSGCRENDYTFQVMFSLLPPICIRLLRVSSSMAVNFAVSSASIAFLISSRRSLKRSICGKSISLFSKKSSVHRGAFIIAIRVRSSKLPPPKAVIDSSSALSTSALAIICVIYNKK